MSFDFHDIGVINANFHFCEFLVSMRVFIFETSTKDPGEDPLNLYSKKMLKNVVLIANKTVVIYI